MKRLLILLIPCLFLSCNYSIQRQVLNLEGKHFIFPSSLDCIQNGDKYQSILLSQNIEALSYIECYYDQYGIVVINTDTNEIKYDQRVKKGKRSCKLKYGKVCTLSIN